MKIYNKLVRDKIPSIIKESGSKPNFTTLPLSQYKTALLSKLLEEAKECYCAYTDEQLTEELADLLEVVDTICNTYNITKDEVLLKQAKKKAERGGFNKRYWLRGVGE